MLTRDEVSCCARSKTDSSLRTFSCISKTRALTLAASLALTAALLVPLSSTAQTTSTYVQTNIISDGAVAAQTTDPTLINPWGVSIGAQFWIDAAGSGFSLVDEANGTKDFAVSVPPASSALPHGLPAGTVFNSDSNVFVIPGGASALFLFGDLDGTITAWNTNTPNAVKVIDNSSAKAAYTDIATVKNSSGTFLLAANFAGGTVDVFDSSFKSASLAGSFADPALPSGYAPFGIHSIGSDVYVTYAEPNAQGRETLGAGLGYVDKFDSQGNLEARAISQGNLNAPWGMALAPASFGSYGGMLLVGNFGDGVINVYDPASFAFKGQLSDAKGAPIANPGLWEIVFGTSTVGDPNTLYFAAGINNEKDGLFGSIALAQPVTGTADFSIQAATSSVTIQGGSSGSVKVNLAGTNGFSGPVALACSGLPVGLACSFSPASVTVSGTTTTAVTVDIAASTPTTTNPYVAAGKVPQSVYGRKITLAGLFPAFLLLLGFRKRMGQLRSSILGVLLAVMAVGMVTGCGSSKSVTPPTTTTPATTEVTISATSGSLTHTVKVGVTVN